MVVCGVEIAMVYVGNTMLAALLGLTGTFDLADSWIKAISLAPFFVFLGWSGLAVSTRRMRDVRANIWIGWLAISASWAIACVAYWYREPLHHLGLAGANSSVVALLAIWPALWLGLVTRGRAEIRRGGDGSISDSNRERR